MGLKHLSTLQLRQQNKHISNERRRMMEDEDHKYEEYENKMTMLMTMQMPMLLLIDRR